MANYANLKSAIQQVIKTNGNNEITGALLQQSLLAIITSLGGYYQFAGIATPSTNPGTPDQNVFYIGGAGTYSNFSSLVIPTGYIGVLKYNGTWTLETVQAGDVNAVKFVAQTLTDNQKTQARTNIEAASNEQVSQLEAKVTGLVSQTFSANSAEHSAASDQLLIDLTAGETIKYTLSQGTGVCDGSTLRIRFFKNGTNVQTVTPTFGTQGEVTLSNDVDSIGVYLYRVTTYGTFVLSLVIPSIESNTAKNSADIQTLNTGVQALNVNKGGICFLTHYNDKLPNISTQARTLTIPHHSVITYNQNGIAFEQNNDIEINLAIPSGAKKVIFDWSNNTFSCVSYNTVLTSTQGVVMLIRTDYNANGQFTQVYSYSCSCECTIDGGVPYVKNKTFDDFYKSVTDELGYYVYSFNASGSGHSSLNDQFPIDYKANTPLRGIIKQGTAVSTGAQTQAILFASDGTTVVKQLNITLGQEFEITATADAKYIGFYIYQITTAGTFDVELSYGRIKREVEDLSVRVANLENGALPIPSYFEENTKETIISAREDMSVVGLDGENLVFITDMHWESNTKHSPAIIQRICGELNIDNVVFGGDAINGQASQETAMEMFATIAGQLLNARSRNFVAVIGNHDFNSADGGTAFADGPKVFYSIFNKNMDYLAKHGSPTYYYFDNPSTQTRFIVLDTGASYTVPETQANWLTQVLNNTDASLRVVIFMHTFLRERAKYQDDTFIGYDYEVASSGQTVEGIVDTAKANGKNIQCVIAGHAHIDYNVQTDGRIPVIGTDCDGRQSLQWGTTVGTINEQAFDVITIDYVNKTIKCRRVGRGKSRIIHYEAIEMSVGETLDISSDIEIVPTSYSVRDNLDIKYRNAAGGGPSLTYGGSIANVSNSGVVTAISGGLLTAVAENDDCIETFNIKIS